MSGKHPRYKIATRNQPWDKNGNYSITSSASAAQPSCTAPFFSFFFFKFYVYVQPFGLWHTTDISTYMLWPGSMPFSLSTCALSRRHDCFYCDFWVEPSWVYPSNSSPAWSFFRSHSSSLSLAPSLPPTSVVFKNLSSGATAFSFPSKLANHLLSPWACHTTPSFSSSLTSFLRSFLHFRHLVYKCSTDCTVSLHHQHSRVSITPILARYVRTAPCPSLSW